MLNKWIMGLLRALISGGASGSAAWLVASKEINLAEGWDKFLIVSAVGAMIGIFNYLSQSPLPREES